MIKEWKAKQKKSVNPSGFYNSGRSWYHDSSQGRYLFVQDKKKYTVRLPEKTTTKKVANTKFIQKLLTTKIETKKVNKVDLKKESMQTTTTEDTVTDIPSLLYWLEKAVLKIFADQLPPNNPIVTKTETENLAKLAIEKSKMERLATKQRTTKKRPTTTKTTKSKKKATMKKTALSCWIKKEGATQKAPINKSTKQTTEILQYGPKAGFLVTVLTKKLTAAKSTTKMANLRKKTVEKSPNGNNSNKLLEHRKNIEDKKQTIPKYDKKVSSKVKVIAKASKQTSTTKTFKNESAIECLLQKSGQHRGYYDCINVK